jgi:hypothetical protein
MLVMRNTDTAAWVDVGSPSKNVWGVPDGACPLPLFSPNFQDPLCSHGPPSPPGSPVIVSRHSSASESAHEHKAELHKVLNCIQASADYGVYVCEDLRDPRRQYIDDYWAEIREQAFGLDDMHRLLGSSTSPLSEEARTRFHRLARLFERLSKRLDRVVLAT